MPVELGLLLFAAEPPVLAVVVDGDVVGRVSGFLDFALLLVTAELVRFLFALILPELGGI